ncbi:MAG: SH3 domain-containing protein, partial [Tumebacillaceae bacterium]
MRLKRGNRIKSASKKARKQRLNKVPLALVAVTTVLSATSVFTAEPVLAADSSNVATGAKAKTTDYLNLRTGAGKNFSALKVLAPNTLVTVLGKSGDFTKVQTSDGSSGWVWTSYLHMQSTPPPNPAPSNKGKQAKVTDYLNLRTGADKNAPATRVLSPGTQVIILDQSGDFTKVQTGDGHAGWVWTQYVQVQIAPPPAPKPTPTPQPTPTPSGNGTPATVTDYLNFRNGASTSAGVLSVLQPGTLVQYLNRSGEWSQVRLNDGRVGWVSSDYITIDDANNVSRITTYPSEPNFYEVRQGTLYHVIGTPTNRSASFSVGTPASFMKSGDIYVRDSNHQFYRRDNAADVKVGAFTPAYEKLDLRLTSPVSAAELNAIIDRNRPDGLLAGKGQVFLDAARKYGVSAQYLFAHAILESGWGTSQISRDKNNFFGYQAYDDSPYASAAYFQSIQDAVEWEAYFVRKQYLDASGQWYGGAPSLDGMNVHYASDPLWSEKIAGLMDSIRAYADADYKGKSPAQVTGGTPTGPLKEIVTQKLPTGALGVTLSGVDVYVMPASNSSQVIAHLQAGASLTVQGMQTDRWYQVQVGPQT